MPPGRKSKVCVVVVKPFGPHHCARCFGSVHTENTSSRGASSTRVPMIERGSCSRSRLLFTLTLLLLRLQRFEIITQPIEALVPKPAILFEPAVGFLERPNIDTARAHLSITCARDEPRPLQHLQVLGNRW